MEKALRHKKIYIYLSVFSFILAVTGFVLALVILNAPGYPLIITCAALSAVFCYVTLFSAFSAYDAALAAKIIPTVLEIGAEHSDEIAERIGWKKTAVKKYINKIKKHGYI